MIPTIWDFLLMALFACNCLVDISVIYLNIPSPRQSCWIQILVLFEKVVALIFYNKPSHDLMNMDS
jgi:hypothetical protein